MSFNYNPEREFARRGELHRVLRARKMRGPQDGKDVFVSPLVIPDLASSGRYLFRPAAGRLVRALFPCTRAPGSA